MPNPFAFRHNLYEAQVRATRFRAERKVARFPTVKQQQPHGLPGQLVISVTSYPPRFPELHKALQSLLDQTVKADATLLFVSESDYVHVPADVRALADHGLTICICDDLRSYKKIMPRILGDDSCYMLTADDDAYYPPDWLASFVEVAVDHPTAIVAGRARLAKFDANGRAEAYETWELPPSPQAPLPAHTRLFPTGVGGVLYPPGSLDSRATDRAAFMELCPEGDDIWLFWMARLAGTEHRQAARQWQDVVWKGTKQTALWGANIAGGGNMRQIRAMEDRFGPVP